MPQGLANAPAAFQRLMDNTFRTLKNTCVLVYLDDINVYSKSFDSHLKDLRKVFTRLGEIGSKLKPKKCSFFKKELEYLGHIVSKDGVKPLPAKLEAIQKMLPPTNVTKLQSFLGLIGYYRRFIPSFANSAQALLNLLKKDVELSGIKLVRVILKT